MIAPIIRIYHVVFIHPYDTSHYFIHVDMLESGTAVQDAIPVNRQRERMRLIPTKQSQLRRNDDNLTVNARTSSLLTEQATTRSSQLDISSSLPGARYARIFSLSRTDHLMLIGPINSLYRKTVHRTKISLSESDNTFFV